MALVRYSINCRLLVVQLVLAVLIVYLNNVANEMRQYQQQTNAIVQNLDDQNPRASKSITGYPKALAPDVVNENVEALNLQGDAFNEGHLQNDAVDEQPQKVENWPDSAFNLSASEKFQKAGLFRCPNLRRPISQQMDVSEQWLKLQQPDGTATLYVYSTVFREATDDQRSAESGPRLDANERRSTRIRLFVMGTVLKTSSRLYCQLWYNDIEQPVVVRGLVDNRLYRADEDMSGGFPLNAYAVVCKEPSTVDHHATGGDHHLDLQHVTLTVDSECPDDSNRAFLPIFRSEEAVSSRSIDERENKLALCIAPFSKERLEEWSSLYNKRSQLSAPWFVEWMELVTLFGATEVIKFHIFNIPINTVNGLFKNCMHFGLVYIILYGYPKMKP
jgi:hypothetical protein